MGQKSNVRGQILGVRGHTSGFKKTEVKGKKQVFGVKGEGL